MKLRDKVILGFLSTIIGYVFLFGVYMYASVGNAWIDKLDRHYLSIIMYPHFYAMSKSKIYCAYGQFFYKLGNGEDRSYDDWREIIDDYFH